MLQVFFLIQNNNNNGRMGHNIVRTNNTSSPMFIGDGYLRYFKTTEQNRQKRPWMKKYSTATMFSGKEKQRNSAGAIDRRMALSAACAIL